jgi:hypothetical protein
VDITKSQDAVITEISEQYVEEASTAEVSNRPAAAVEDAAVEPPNVQIAVGGIGDVPPAMHVNLPLEKFSSLGQRDGYESREASNGTGLYGFDEKVEAGTKTSMSSMCYLCVKQRGYRNLLGVVGYFFDNLLGKWWSDAHCGQFADGKLATLHFVGHFCS